MPFYALSNLLTLFAHDMPTLPLIQHVFDYMLCRPPIAGVYLATAIDLARKREAIQLKHDDEDGVIHSLLSSLPDLVDDHGEFGGGEGCLATTAGLKVPILKAEEVSPPVDFETPETRMATGQMGVTDSDPFRPETAVSPYSPPHSRGASEEIKSERQPLPPPSRPDTNTNINPDTSTDSTTPHPNATDTDTNTTVNTLTAPSQFHPKSNKSKSKPKSPQSSQTSSDTPTLYTQPTRPPGSIWRCRPSSVVFTWSELFSALSSDEECEAMVSHPELVVYPAVEGDVNGKEEEGMQGSGAEDE